MKETTPTIPPGQQVRSTTCEPNLLRPNQPQNPQNSNVKPPNKTLGDHNAASLVTGQ